MIITEEFLFTATVDTETDIITIESTESEPKTIRAVRVFLETNRASLRGYWERKRILEYPTGESGAITNSQELPIDLVLPPGDDFRLAAINRVAGVNATIRGLVEYEITA